MTDTLDDLKRQLAEAIARHEALETTFPTGDEFRDNSLAQSASDDVERLKERISAREANPA